MTFALRCVGANQRLSLYENANLAKEEKGGKHAAKNAETKKHERLCYVMLCLFWVTHPWAAPLDPREADIIQHFQY